MVLEKYRRLFRCSNRRCLKQESISKTFVRTSTIGVNKVLQISYLFLIGTPAVEIIEVTALSSPTVTEWTLFIRQLFAYNIDFSDAVIWGNVIVVEVDETKLGKRKYYKGHRVEGVWVIAGIERTEEKECFVVEVENRDVKIMKDILFCHIFLEQSFIRIYGKHTVNLATIWV
ncbi:hypothetical protein RF11_11486 [Thelohanellus kitauei]|uniref:ISXO2-like transposase domain-containing protein n=1 Tax=Thelohanellus kitauei TaxID=669202 RepID=A0A0C2J1H9_THEKT|nr:hypothetical protein RF11_11486 [Thelohanellus kitauei]